MKIRTLLAAIAGIAILAGCEQVKTPTEQVRDVAFYQANPAELKTKLAECENDPGTLENTPNCKNAAQAKHLNMTGPSTVDYSGLMGNKK